MPPEFLFSCKGVGLIYSVNETSEKSTNEEEEKRGLSMLSGVITSLVAEFRNQEGGLAGGLLRWNRPQAGTSEEVGNKKDAVKS